MNNKKDFLLVDAHIHIHDCFDLDIFFSSAESNFKRQAQLLNLSRFQSILCLTESQGTNVYSILKKHALDDVNVGKWNIQSTNNVNTLLLTNKNYKIFVIAGKQIITKEKLEVLAIGLEEEYADGEPIGSVLETVTNSKSIPIIPWGFGKWTGKRKTIVENLTLQDKFYSFHLGDNGNRSWFMKQSSLFITARDKNIHNLPGSDPLPFSREVHKPGSFGFAVEGSLNENKPFESFYSIVKNTNSQYQTYGKLESLFYFLKNQVAMQIVKRNR